MNIGIHSDLHTECSLCTISNLSELDVLILAGDIGDPATVRLFFDYLRRKTTKLPVLYVLGNHEYYGFAISEAKDIYRSISQEYGITLLDDESIILNGIQFSGTTLWSDFTLADKPADAMRWAGEILPDFREIYDDDGEPLTPQKMVALHKKSRAFLKEALQQPAEKHVVISHFLPRSGLIAKRHYHKKEGLTRSAYWANELPELTERADLWIYGHSHDNINTYIDSTRFASNQRGYSKAYDGSELRDYNREYYILL